MSQKENLIDNQAVIEHVLNEGKTIISQMLRKAEKMSIEARWHLGDLLTKHDSIIKSKAQIEYLASKWGIWTSELYRMKALRKIYPTIERLQISIKQIEAIGNHPPTWNYYRTHVLPKEHHKPEAFGGEENAIASTLDKIEYYTNEAANLSNELLNKYETYDIPTQQEIEGSLLAVFEALQESQTVAVKLERLAKNLPNRSSIHLNLIRKMRCVICGIEQTEAHHVQHAGLSEKGSDYLTIPLCHFHHQNYTDWGKIKWESKYHNQLEYLVIALSTIYNVPKYALIDLIEYAKKENDYA